MFKFFYKLWKILRYIGDQYVEDECSRTAAALSYSTLLALVPIMLISLVLASQVPAFEHATNTIRNFVLNNFVTTAASSLSTYLNEFLKQVNRLTWTNALAFTFTSLLLLYNMVHAFNRVWDVKMVWHRRFTLRFLFYFGILIITPLLLAILMILISYVTSLSLFSDKHFQQLVTHPFLVALPYVAAFITFSYFNWVLPTCRVRLRFAFIAGFVTTCIFELIKYLFTLYVGIFPTYRIIYGALATIPIFFLWIYLSWITTLLGAILCKGMQDHFDPTSHGVFD